MTDGRTSNTVNLSLTADQALALAGQHLEAGNLADAANVCRQIIIAQPDNAPALHLLGIISHHGGDLPNAIALVRKAIAANGRVALYHCNLGEMYRLTGERDLALEAGKRALTLDPNLLQALNNVGIVRYEREEYEEAVQLYRRAVAASPNYAEAYSNLGNALRAQEKYDEALAAYGKALSLKPDYGDAINNMGTALRDMGNLPEAEAAYRRALTIQPGDVSTLNNLALLLKDKEQYEEAALLLARSLERNPGNVETLVYMGLIKLDQKNAADADLYARQALALAPEDPEALNLMGLVHFDRQESDLALDLFERAVAGKPELADAHNNIGNIRKENGEFATALESFARAVELKPKEAAYYFNLADAKKFKPGDTHLLAMESFLRDGKTLTDTARQRLDFALAKAYSDLDRHDEAFARLAEGNALKRRQIAYDEAGMFGLFDRVAAVFNSSLIAEKAKAGFASSLPVFVVGMPRSGTTLVEQILASHPAIHGAGELSEVNRLVAAMTNEGGGPFCYPDDAAALTAHQVRQLGQDYVEGLRRRAPEAQRITDKMPANFMFLGLIHMAMPGARIIHVQRDPRDTCLSCYSKLFSAEQNFSYDLGELGRYYRKYSELMAHWREVLPKGVLFEIRYEDVVADLEGAARKLVEYCGLEWDPACTLFHETRRPVRTASASQVRRPLYTSSQGRWRAYQNHLGPLLTALGEA